jgi:hypothetical protein
MTTQTVRGSAPVDRAGLSTTRIGAGLGLAGVVVTIAGFALVAPADAVHTLPAADIVGFYSEGDPTGKYAGGFVESVGLLLLLPFIALLVGRLGRRGVPGELLAPTAMITGGAYVLFSLAPGQAAGAAALWLGHSGDAEPAALLALNDLRSFSYFLALLSLAAFLVCVGIGGAATRAFPRWIAWSAVGIGTALAAGVAVAHTGLADLVSLVAMSWLVATAVALLRRPGTDASADQVTGR